MEGDFWFFFLVILYGEYAKHILSLFYGKDASKVVYAASMIIKVFRATQPNEGRL